MSLWCGSCRKEIYRGFGILYRLERSEGRFLYPDKARDYVPANSAICESCWRGLPNSEKHTDGRVKAELEMSSEAVFAYALADSSSTSWGSKTWGGIRTDDGRLVFVRSQAVELYLPRALEIIGTGRTHPT